MSSKNSVSRIRSLLSWYLDIYQWEHRVVRARNYLNLRFQAKDSPEKRKIFVVGNPRSGNHSLHLLFQGNGLKSYQSPGIWRTREYDCFSDRGNFWPFHLLDHYYPNSLFILNTRPVYKYIRSVINHRFGRGKKSSGLFEPSVGNIRNEIIERNQDILRFVKHFKEKSNLLVANIERSGCFSFICRQTGLQMIELENTPKSSWREKDLAKIEKAFQDLGIENHKEEPFLLDSLTNEKDIILKDEFLSRHHERILL